MEADIGTICISAEGEQGGTCRAGPPHSPPLLLLYSYIGWLQNSIVQISRNSKFWWNYLEFCEISRNSRKILQNMKLNISQNFCEITKTKFFAATLLLHNLLSAAKLPSAKTIFFFAAMLLWDEDDICTVVFNSVIFNSVVTFSVF